MHPLVSTERFFVSRQAQYIHPEEAPYVRKDPLACDIAVLARIPYHNNLLNDYNDTAMYDFRQRFGFTLLFLSGNGRAPTTLGNVNELAYTAKNKDYRAILAMTDLVRYVDANNELVGLTFVSHTAMGYTPLRLPIPTDKSWPSIRSKGRPRNPGVAKPKKFETPNEWRVQLALPFKLGMLPDIVQTIFTRQFAPSAVIKIAFSIFPDGPCRVRIFSTSIPTCHFYVNGNRVAAHYMVPLNGNSINGFFRRANCTPAPYPIRWQGVV